MFSRFVYLEDHIKKNILLELKNQEAPSKPHALTEEESQRVDELIKDIPEGKLRDSFRKAITAQKQNHTDK